MAKKVLTLKEIVNLVKEKGIDQNFKETKENLLVAGIDEDYWRDIWIHMDTFVPTFKGSFWLCPEDLGEDDLPSVFEPYYTKECFDGNRELKIWILGKDVLLYLGNTSIAIEGYVLLEG